MKATMTILAAAALASAAGTAGASTAGCTPAGNVLGTTYRPFRGQLVDSVRPYQHPAQSPAAVAMPLCGPAAAVSAGMQAVAHQRRFYVLLAALPARPTRSQWRARWRPLLEEAAAADQAYLSVVSGIFRADPGYGGIDRRGMTAALAADRAWLVREEGAAYGSTIA